VFEKNRPVKYRTIRLREEVADLLDEWKELFDDASMSEVMWRVFALARRELKRVKEKKRKAAEKFVKDRKKPERIADIADKSVV